MILWRARPRHLRAGLTESKGLSTSHLPPVSRRAQEKSWALFNSGVAATLWTGKREVKILHLGCGHTKGDTVVWLPQEKILFSGDLLEYAATPYAGEAYLNDIPWGQVFQNSIAIFQRPAPILVHSAVTPFC